MPLNTLKNAWHATLLSRGATVVTAAVIMLAASCVLAATSPKTAGNKPTVKVVTGKKGDRISIAVEGAAAVLSVHSKRGIGSAEVTRLQKSWPGITIRFHFRGLESLRISNGKVTLSASVLSHGNNKRLLHRIVDGKEQKVEPGSPYWMEIRIVAGAGGKPKIPLEDGYFDVRIPKAMLGDDAKSISLRWIDLLRG